MVEQWGRQCLNARECKAFAATRNNVQQQRQRNLCLQGWRCRRRQMCSCQARHLRALHREQQRIHGRSHLEADTFTALSPLRSCSALSGHEKYLHLSQCGAFADQSPVAVYPRPDDGVTNQRALSDDSRPNFGVRVSLSLQGFLAGDQRMVQFRRANLHTHFLSSRQQNRIASPQQAQETSRVNNFNNVVNAAAEIQGASRA